MLGLQFFIHECPVFCSHVGRSSICISSLIGMETDRNPSGIVSVVDVGQTKTIG